MAQKYVNRIYFFFIFFIKVLLLGIFSVHTPGYKNDLNCSFNQFTWVVTHPVRGIKGSDLLGFDITAVKNRIKIEYVVHSPTNEFFIKLGKV